MTDGSPVTIELTITEAYSFERSTAIASPRPSVLFTRAYSSRFASLRLMYSSTGIR